MAKKRNSKGKKTAQSSAKKSNAKKPAAKAKVAVKTKATAKNKAAAKAKAGNKNKSVNTIKPTAKSKGTAKSTRPTGAAGKAGRLTPASNTKVSLKPIRDMILIRPDQASDRTPGGLFIPQSAEEKPYQGTVVAAGRGTYSKKGRFKPTSVQEGDRVLYWKFGGQEITLNQETLVIMKESDLLGFAANK